MNLYNSTLRSAYSAFNGKDSLTINIDNTIPDGEYKIVLKTTTLYAESPGYFDIISSPSIAMPNITPSSGTYVYTINVNFSDITQNVAFHYTFAFGSNIPPDPTQSDPSSTGIGFYFDIPQDITLKVRAYDASGNYSPVAKVSYHGVVGVTIGQADENKVAFDSAAYRYLGTWNYVHSGNKVGLALDTNWNFLASQTFKQGTTQKFNNWTSDGNLSSYLDYARIPIRTGSEKVAANFQSAYSAIIQNSLDGATQTTGSKIGFTDPWVYDSTGSYGSLNRGTKAKWYDSLSSPYTISANTNSYFHGVFLNQNPQFQQGAPIYSVRVPLTQTISGFTSYFQNWSTPGAVLGTISLYTDINGLNYWQAPVVFDSVGASVTANYKAHLGTGSPSLANTKNQRRILYGQDRYGIKCWLSVYESMGDIWMTMYDENGYVIVPETRLNTKHGAASNPTISNTVNFGSTEYDRAVIGWLENSNGNIELHLQSVNFQGDGVNAVWGWAGNDPNRLSSYAVLNGNLGTNPYGYWGIQDNPTSSARPVLSLLPNGSSGFLLTYAYETNASGKGIIAGQLQTTASNQDLNCATQVGTDKTVSIDVSAKLPAIATLGASHIFIYYTTGSYSI